MSYRGRLAPTPTGGLHLGHARTFHAAWQRARRAHGHLTLRIEDLDHLRCRREHTTQLLADFAWLGLDWDEGPIYQSRRREIFVDAWARLREVGAIYPSTVSRKEVRDAAHAPHEEDEGAEPIFPAALRTPPGEERRFDSPAGVTWRFRVPDGRAITFDDARRGRRSFTAGVDFGDFIVWRKDDVPAYELAVVADDIAMRITEVVRGDDLLKSTARQLLVYEALGAAPPSWCHEPLVRDAEGKRLAKRHAPLSLQHFRDRGMTPEEAWTLSGIPLDG